MHPSELNFTTPGAGQWSTDGLHAYHPVSAIGFELRNAPSLGMRIGFSRYGYLIDGLQNTVIHRFAYGQIRLVCSRHPGEEAQAHRRFNAESAANPEIQERFARAEFAISTKRWRADREHWDSVGRPWMMGRTLELTDLNPRDMSDEGLLLHLAECMYHHQRAGEYHHILNPVQGLPRGLFFLRAAELTGMTADELEPLMVGSSPISAGDEPELRALHHALGNNEKYVELLSSDKAADEILDKLYEAPGDIGRLAKAYVRLIGMRNFVNWEVMDPYILEKPELIVRKIRFALEGGEHAALDQNFVATVRDKVPDASKTEFDELFADALANSRIRDERDIFCNMPTSGLTRRAVLEAGRRAVERGRIDDQELMTEAAVKEIRLLLEGTDGPTSTQLQDRHDYRRKYSIRDVPETLGIPDQIPVNPDWLPPASRQIALVGFGGLDADPEEEKGAREIKGRKASPGRFTGTARLINSATELHRIQQGDILVTTATNPAFNIVLPQLGAIVTAYGGVLSHAAIVAREFGLPAVIGCKNVMDRITDGARVEVDGDTGTVTLLD